VSEFFGESDFVVALGSQEDYGSYLEGQAPVDFANDQLVFFHPGRTAIGTDYLLYDLFSTAQCQLEFGYGLHPLGDNCETFTTYTRPAPLLARISAERWLLTTRRAPVAGGGCPTMRTSTPHMRRIPPVHARM
jgi:hypothetical protein